MLQRPRNFHYTNLVISVIAIFAFLLALKALILQLIQFTPIDTAGSSSPSPSPTDSPASADMLGVSNVEINFKDASKIPKWLL